MKSIVQEASSIERAIDKAWNEAGKPRSFTIEVLDEGEKTFFGFSRRTAKVTILYEQAQVTYIPEHRKNAKQPTNKRSMSPDAARSERTKRAAGGQPRTNAPRSGSDSRDLMRDVRDSHREGREARLVDDSGRLAALDGRQVSAPQPEEWTANLQRFANDTITELMGLCGVKVPFKLSVGGGRELTVTFSKNVMTDNDEQRMFFASISYLVIQFIKREHKQRFTGFKVIVTAEGGVPVTDMEEALDARPARNNDRRSDRSRGGSRDRDNRDGNGSREPRERRERRSSSEDSIAEEQRRFAQRQLEQEGEDESGDSSGITDNAVDIVAEMRRAAQEEQSKYRPFYAAAPQEREESTTDEE